MSERIRFRAIAEFSQTVSPPATVLPAAPPLGAPSWSHAAEFQHEEEAVLRVDAQGNDGRMVRFRVERLREGRWVPYATASAPVRGGVATARIVVRHHAARRDFSLPLPDGETVVSAEPAQLRACAEIV